MWSEWAALTRLMWSGRIAFEHEIGRYHISGGVVPSNDTVRLSVVGGDYETSVAKHLASLRDDTLFCGLVLARSYTLLESHAKLVRHVLKERDLSAFGDDLSEDIRNTIEADRLEGGIAAWSDAILRASGQSWDLIYGGRGGLIEVAEIRNAWVHGHTHVGAKLDATLQVLGVASFPRGTPLRLDFAVTHEYRGRIRSYCRAIADGAVHLIRGTHRSPPT